MSETEFDQYLALLSGLLRLNASQREEIASELRDHLEERLAELLSQGVSRARAIEMTLEEFGDLAGLAGDFAQIFRQQRRRWMMRMTLRTAAGLAALAVLTTAFWPQGRPGPAPWHVLAQEEADHRPTLVRSSRDEDQNLEQQLRQRLDVDFFDVQFAEAFQELCLDAGLQFYVKARYLEEEGVAMDMPVTLQLKKVSVEMALDLILEQLDLTYVIRDGVLLVTTEDDLDNVVEVRVYNCRDLLASEFLDSDAEADVNDYGSEIGGYIGPTDETKQKKRKGRSKNKSRSDAQDPAHSSWSVVPRDVLAQFGGGGMGGGGMVVAHPQRPPTREDRLMQLIMTAVKPDSWEEFGGGPGTIAEFDGLIVIRHNPRIHRQVEHVLEMLREASSQQPWSIFRDDVAPSELGGGGHF